MSIDLTISLVLFQNKEEQILELLNSFRESTVKWELVVYDNSPTNSLSSLFQGSNIQYLHDPRNIGFGRGHNKAFSHKKNTSEFHLVVNPDISFEPLVLERMIDKMKGNENIGILAPKVLFPDGTLQRTARLLPTPLDFFIRRFCPFSRLQDKINERYEIYSYDYSYPIEIPFISGCFMLLRSKFFKDLGGFDERFFMYTEDIDLTRRMMQLASTVLDPSFSVYHEYERGSHKNCRLLFIFLKSAFQYFNKWGWIFDKERNTCYPKAYKSSE